jgi:hypothetical protein
VSWFTNERFWSKVKISDQCWVWCAATFRSGYGSFNSKYSASKLAHRYSYEEFYGPIPEGMCVLHTCDVRNCVRPTHLFLGTLKDNAQDAWNKGRGKVPDNSGDKQGRAKLTWADVHRIRKINPVTSNARKIVCAKYGITGSNLYYILSGRSWKVNGKARSSK